MRTIRPGSHGDDVRDIQARLAALGFTIDAEEIGDYGAQTERAVREFQQARHLLVDGLVGPETWEELVEAGYSLGDRVLYHRYPYFRGDDVKTLQSRLNLLGFDTGKEDGIFGRRTDGAVREFQRNVGLLGDGIVGRTTLQALTRLRPVGEGPGRAAVREGEGLRTRGRSLSGARIAVDAGHHASDPGSTGPGGVAEHVATLEIADALAEELRARGAEPVLLRTGETAPSATERAEAANDADADVLVSIHLNTHGDAAAEGASTYYYGRQGYVSQAGQLLAELIQEELVERLGLKDGRTHPKSLPLLRETHMPAVQVEPCFITNPREAAMLRDAGFRQRLVEALAAALARFLGEGAVPASATAGEEA